MRSALCRRGGSDARFTRTDSPSLPLSSHLSTPSVSSEAAFPPRVTCEKAERSTKAPGIKIVIVVSAHCDDYFSARVKLN